MAVWIRGARLALSLAVASALGCGGAPGQPGPAGPAGTRANAQGVESDCAPGAYFCDGTKLWRCTRNGLDAKLVQDCAAAMPATYGTRGAAAPAPAGAGRGAYDDLPAVYGTVTNPFGCQTERCPLGAGACCAASEPTCAWDLTSGLVASGSYRYGQAGTAVCTAASAAGCVTSSTPFQVTWIDTTQTCPAERRTLALAIDRTVLQPGTLNIQAAGAAVALQLTQGDPARSCAAWSGTIEWAEAPTWSVRIDASCTETGKGSLVLRGTLHGRT